MKYRASSGAHRRQSGFILIEALIAVAMFIFGLLAISKVYGILVPAQTSSEYTSSVAGYGNQFWGLIQANPAALNTIGAGNTVTYTSTSVGSAPATLQPWLNNIFTGQLVSLSNASVTITLGADSAGTACVLVPVNAMLCGVTLTITWTPVATTLANSATTRT
ncbi:MAG: hypothetical protein JO370_07450, partial [Paucibacter sp.]|nr:hypothetical protein [Roseateles sp.]